MGVSIDSNPDLNAIIEGGEGFVTRMKELKAAKDEAEKSFAKLKIGKDAAAAYADAQKNQQGAKQALLDAQAEAERIVAEAKALGETMIQEAAAEAEKRQNAKIAEFAKLDEDMKAAKNLLLTWSEETNKKASALLEQAQAQAEAADAKLAGVKKREAEAVAAKKEMEAQTKAAKEAEDSFNAKLAAIKAAVS